MIQVVFFRFLSAVYQCKGIHIYRLTINWTRVLCKGNILTPQAVSCAVDLSLAQLSAEQKEITRGLAVTCLKWSSHVLRVHMSVVDLCFRLCSLLQYLRTFTKLVETRDQRSFCCPVICCRRKWPHHGPTQRQTPQRKPLAVCHLAVTLLQQAAINIILLATSAKESVTKGHGNGRSFQVRMAIMWQDHSQRSFLQARSHAGSLYKALVFRMSAWAPWALQPFLWFILHPLTQGSGECGCHLY